MSELRKVCLGPMGIYQLTDETPCSVNKKMFPVVDHQTYRLSSLLTEPNGSKE